MAPANSARRRGFTLTVRLAVTYALLVTATLLVVAGVATQLIRSHLSDTLDERIAAVVRAFREGPATRIEGAEDLPAEARAWLAESAFPDDQVVAVRTASGDVLTSSGGIALEDLMSSENLLTATTSRWWDVEGPDGPVRALTTPLVLDGETAGTLVVAASRADEEGTLSGLLSGIAWAAGLGLAFATVLGVIAVRRTMRPLRKMASEVETIQETGDLSRRVGRTGPEDEVGRLAGSFDAMLARLEEAFGSQRRFLSDASHELRTPLQVARGQLELLEEEIKGADARRSLALLEEELERMRRIVDDLLLLARLDEGMPLVRRPVEVELIVREALLRGMQLARRQSYVDVEPGLHAMADPERLLQVLTNLVANAVRHGGDDATLHLRGRHAGDRVEIAVSDDGPGIPAEDLPHVFERLYRGSKARTGFPGGAGLGLAIAASLVEAMGGGIRVESEPGRGTTFIVALPSADADITEPIASRS